MKEKNPRTILIELGLLFLPAAPAYLWLWPNLSGRALDVMNVVTYLYILAGTFFIGRRRWRYDELGLTWKGAWISLAFGMAVVVGRGLVIASVNWGKTAPTFELGRFLFDVWFYFLLVGLGEELLFRGLVFRFLEDWRGIKWAIWGSSLGFVLWHVFGHGVVVGAAMLLYGLIFALMRWRSGGTLGLAIVHGAIDLAAAWTLPETDVVSLGRPEISHPFWLWIGLALIIATPLILWKGFPIQRRT